LLSLSIALYPYSSKFLDHNHTHMETAHDIFVEREHNWERKTFAVQDMIKSISYPMWAKNTIAVYGDSIKDLYILLICYPGWTTEQRNAYLKEYKKEIIDAFGSVNTDYMEKLHVSIGHNGSAVSYSPQAFVSIKQEIGNLLQKEQWINEILWLLKENASTSKKHTVVNDHW